MFFYLWDDGLDAEDPPPENYIGKLSHEEMWRLRRFWDEVIEIVGFIIPFRDTDMIIKPQLVSKVYNLCLEMHQKANHEYYFEHKVKVPYMMLYDKILEILKMAYDEKKSLLLYDDE
jgi:hypothetical protein